MSESQIAHSHLSEGNPPSKTLDWSHTMIYSSGDRSRQQLLPEEKAPGTVDQTIDGRQEKNDREAAYREKILARKCLNTLVDIHTGVSLQNKLLQLLLDELNASQDARPE